MFADTTRKALVLVFLAAIVAGCGSSVTETPSPSPIPTPTPTPSPTMDPGVAIIEAFVDVMSADPWVGHVVQNATSRATIGEQTVEIVVEFVADVRGSEIRATMTGSGGGVDLAFDMIVTKENAYLRSSGEDWTVVPASAIAAQMSSIEDAIRIVDDPADLRYVGPDTFDGQAAHHLANRGELPYTPASGGTGSYTSLDIWVLEDGTPLYLEAEIAFTGLSGNQVIEGDGTTTMSFDNVGGPVEIVAPSVAP